MKVIDSNSTLQRHLLRLIRDYPSIAFAVAWASADTDIFSELLRNQRKIKKAIIGTHFYQTHPDVLDNFVPSRVVRFITQPEGIFHPKVYVFWDQYSNWEALIASANLTKGALTGNSEVVLHISNKDVSASGIKRQLLTTINRFWEDANARTISKVQANAYRELWKQYQSSLRRVSGQYGNTASKKSPFDSKVMTMQWGKFFAAVKREPYDGFQKRRELLTRIREAFESYDSFSSMEIGLRKAIAGLPTDYDPRWDWFGSMKGAGVFHREVNNNNPFISDALENVPLHGPIVKDHFDGFLEEFFRAFPNGGHGIAVASRLLALKRPDYFLCLNGKNKSRLCKDFGIRQPGMNYERYWDEVVVRITDSTWWNSPCPKDRIERTVWNGRAAMLDAIFYEP